MTSTREPVEKTVEENIPGGRWWNRWTNPSPPFPRFFFSFLKLNLFYEKFHHRSHQRPTRHQWTTGGSVPRSTSVPRHSSRYHSGARSGSGGGREGVGRASGGVSKSRLFFHRSRLFFHRSRLILCTITQMWYNKRVGDPTNNEEIEMNPANNAKARDLVDQLSHVALDRGRQFNGGNQDYAYSYGFLSSLMKGLFTDMELSNDQIKTLQECVDYQQRRGQ